MNNMTADLKLHLAMDSLVDGELKDTSGSNHTTIFHGDPKLVSDSKFGSCLQFGSGDFLTVNNIADSALNDSSFTISMWVKISKNPNGYFMWNGDKQSYHDSTLCLYLSGNSASSTYYFQTQQGYASKSRKYKKNEWMHIVCRYDRELSKQSILINGQLLVSDTTKKDFSGTGALSIGQSTGSGFEGDIAHMRIYKRALSMAAIQEVMVGDQSAAGAYRDSHPLDIDLRDGNDDAVLFISNHAGAEKLALDLLNTSPNDLEFSAAGAKVDANADNFHVELRFRPGTLSPRAFSPDYNKDHIALVAPDGWAMSLPVKDPKTGTVSLYFLYQGKKAGERVSIPRNGLIGMELRNICADGQGGARGSRVEFRYRNLYHAGAKEPIGGEATLQSRSKHLNIVNHRGKAEMPLHVGFAGSNTILNVGTKPSSLTLRLTNVMRLDPSYPERSQLNFVGKTSETPSKFFITFDVDADWALGKVGEVNKIHLKHNNAPLKNLSKTGEVPVWILVLPKDLTLAAGEHIEIEITGIVSSAVNGQANLYLHYENIPGFWDGQKICVIEKAPIVNRGHMVGIGTADPKVPLHIVHKNQDANGGTLTLGPVTASHLRLGYHQDYSWIQSYLQTSYPGYKPLVLNPVRGDVAIGATSSKGYKLYVNGNVRAAAYYDLDDTTHFLNPSGLSNLNRANFSSSSSHVVDVKATAAGYTAITATSTKGRALTATSTAPNYPTVWVSATKCYAIQVEGASNIYAAIKANGTGSASTIYAHSVKNTAVTAVSAGAYATVNASGTGSGSTIHASATGASAVYATASGDNYTMHALNTGTGGGLYATASGSNVIYASGTSSKYPTIMAYAKNTNTINARNSASTKPTIWAKNSGGGVTFYSGGGKAYGQASSRRMKENIRPLSDSLQTVLGLEGVRFHWKEGGEVGIGFIAEDAAKLIPEAVIFEEDAKTTSGMCYTTVIPFLVEAIKEQNSAITELRDQVEQLSSMVKQLSSSQKNS